MKRSVLLAAILPTLLEAERIRDAGFPTWNKGVANQIVRMLEAAGLDVEDDTVFPARPHLTLSPYRSEWGE